MAAAIDFAAVSHALTSATRRKHAGAPERRVTGGCINDCFRWTCSSGARFVKLAPVARAAMLEAEADGLQALAAAQAVRVPAVLACGRTRDVAFLALEWLEQGATSTRSEVRLGEHLAAQHHVTATRHGWHRDNTIGLTPQENRPSGSWLEFFGERRLRFQLTLAERNGFARLLADRGRRLLETLPALLGNHAPQASLLHGDLWGGNWFTTRDGEPVIFDPAVYHGDREADLAMTHLFGGFSARFHAAYAGSWPLPAGHVERRELYNLYHLLNHANLFGEGYARQAADSIDRLLAMSR